MNYSACSNALASPELTRVNLRLKLLSLLALASMSTTLLTSCAVNPATGQGNLVLMTQEKEKEVGAEEHQKVIDGAVVYEDDDLQAYVESVGNRIVGVSHRADLEFQYTIIDSPEINAFALPGGYVYVNRGLLTFLNSEAELAAVLAHEIAHITARHGVQQDARGKLASVATGVGGFVAAVATGSGYVGSQISEISSIWAQAGMSGYGREAELEADGLGAEYLYNAGYDPSAMIDVITVLKNQEDFNRRVTGQGGGYHGLFATHPRNDTRLKETIANVGMLDTSKIVTTDEQLFRSQINGLIVGPSIASQTPDDRNRHYQTLLGYTLVFPDDWAVLESITTVNAQDEENNSLDIAAQRIMENIDPREFIRTKLEIADLQKSEPLDQFRLVGHTGTHVTATGEIERIAVIYMGPRAFIIRGKVRNPARAEEVDQQFLASIRTFREIQRTEMIPGGELRLKYAVASEFFDFATVAQESRLAEHPEEMLRLINGYYPTGTPAAGEWIKLVE